jgi:CRISPR-associated protein Csd2
MGRKHIVPYGLYRAHGFISANLAERTGFSEDDLEIFWSALTSMFEHDRSAARGEMAARRLIVFKHKDKLGNAPAHKLFEAVVIAPMNGSDAPRGFADYRNRISINTAGIPSGVEVLKDLDLQ